MFVEKLNSVSLYFQNGDIPLGTRRLIDCVFDTQNTKFYKETLDIIEQHELKKDDAEYTLNVQKLVEKLGQFNLQSPINRAENLLNVNEIAKQYKVSAFKISPINFSLKYGEVIGLVGENGNGKTTLLRLLAKELMPDNGTLTYNIPLATKNEYELRSKLIYIPQRVPRWYGSLMDNLQFTLAQHGIKGDDNLLWAELMVARLGLRPYKNLGWNRISSGYRTRFELAKSLLRKPKLMLLDEPLSNLDIISQQTILQDLKFLSESISNPFGIVLSSQQLYEVEKISDLVIFLKKGEPKYQYKNTKIENEQTDVIYEIETEAEREKLLATFSSIGILKITNNGGVFVLHFVENTKQADIYKAIGNSELPVNYIRNITYSSRRFFIN